MDALWSSADRQLHAHTVLYGDLYIACVDASRMVFWDCSQEGHDFVMVINSSSSDDENYNGLLECACQLAGETSNKSSMEGGMQPGVEPGVEPGVSNIPISKMSDSGLFLSNDMASSLSQSEQSNDVSFSHF